MLNNVCEKMACKHNTASSQNSKIKRYRNVCIAIGECVVIQDLKNNDDVLNVLTKSIKDIGYKNLHLLSDEALEYCLSKERRKTGILKLLAEKAHREQKAGEKQ